jgi:hypothetical protein
MNKLTIAIHSRRRDLNASLLPASSRPVLDETVDPTHAFIASAAKQSRGDGAHPGRDCFVASAPRNDTLCVGYFLVSDGLLRAMGDFNVYGRFRCRFSADAAIGNNRFNYRLQAGPVAPYPFYLHPAFAVFAGLRNDANTRKRLSKRTQ